jgi:SH3-like domain-containing protein
LWICLLCFSVITGAQTEVEIVDFFAKVYLAPNEKSKFVGLAQKGERYQVVEQHDTWVRIRFKNAIGWVYSSQVGPIGSVAAAAEKAIKDSIANAEAAARMRTDTVEKQYSNATVRTDSESERRTSSRSSRVESTVASVSQEPKQNNKPRNWFSKKSLPQLPSINQDLNDTSVLFFQVTVGPARVLSYLDPGAPILGMARTGDYLPLIGEGDSWCKIVFQDTVGWIEHRNGKVVENAGGFNFQTYFPLFLILGVILLIVVVIFIVRARTKKTIPESMKVKKSGLIISKTDKEVQYSLTDSVVSLERCFVEIGFTITTARDNQSIRDALSKSYPEVVLVDWKFDRNILTSLERLFATMPGSEKALFIIYNVPDPASMHPSRILPNMTYLGTAFSDRDIFKIVTPIIISETNKNMQKSVQSSALEGEIGDGNLLEVLQFIEIGRKSGCLLVETDRPFGLIYFTDGRIVYAATAQKVMGKDAIFYILDLKSGKFRFVTDKRPKVTNINLSTLEVLMEWTKALDEAHGN